MEDLDPRSEVENSEEDDEQTNDIENYSKFVLQEEPRDEYNGKKDSFTSKTAPLTIDSYLLRLYREPDSALYRGFTREHSEA